jgi:hypothetical protein
VPNPPASPSTPTAPPTDVEPDAVAKGQVLGWPYLVVGVTMMAVAFAGYEIGQLRKRRK